MGPSLPFAVNAGLRRSLRWLVRWLNPSDQRKKPVRIARLSLMFAVSSLVCAAQSAPAPALPPTPKRPVVDTYWGVKVTDDYRWLEDWSSPEVKSWVAAQNAQTAAYMDKLPQRDAILDYLKKRLTKQSVFYSGFQIRDGRLFALRYDPGAPAAKLVVFSSATDKSSERTIVDFAHLEPDRIFQVDWYHVSPYGALAAISLATGGSEDGSLYVIDTATGQPSGEIIPHVQFATGGGDMAWNAESSGFWYTRYPSPGERPDADLHFYQQVYFHRLGTPVAQDQHVLGGDFPRIAETTFAASPDQTRILIAVANGDGGQFEDFVATPDGQIHQVTRFEDKIPLAAFGQDNSLWLMSHKNSDRGELWHLAAGDFQLSDASLLVHAGEASMEGSGQDAGRIFVGADRLYVVAIDGGPEEIQSYTLAGKRLPDVPAPEVATIGALVPDGSGSFLFAAVTYTTPVQWYQYTESGQPVALPFHGEAAADLSDIDVRRVFAVSKDGAKIPMTILMRRGTPLDGANPALITGYGGYAISTTPSYSGYNRFWFDHGGILAITNLRGGDEYGEGWHKAGMLTDKQHVFDDFIACSQYLIDNHYTSPAHLAAEGGSNGGLLMGAVLTQRPELYRAIISVVGIYDMLRTELDPNGGFNVTEYGTVKDEADFRALYAYSPYHHVVEGTAYPAMLLITGDNDHRVNPAHSRKMTAALQAASSSGRPILLLTNANAGHGLSTNVNEALLERADAEAFLFSQLGMTW
jgi:prolyl oligopeptidase